MDLNLRFFSWDAGILAVLTGILTNEQAFVLFVCLFGLFIYPEIQGNIFEGYLNHIDNCHVFL